MYYIIKSDMLKYPQKKISSTKYRKNKLPQQGRKNIP